MDQKPHLIQEFIIASPWDIPFDLIQMMGIRLILWDLDLALSEQKKLPSQELSNYIVQETKARKLHRWILTNSGHDRSAAGVRLLCGVTQPGRLGLWRKPMKQSYHCALEAANTRYGLQLKPHEVLMYDDKLVNCQGSIAAGMWAIRVKPMDDDTLFFDKVLKRQESDNRKLEEMGFILP